MSFMRGESCVLKCKRSEQEEPVVTHRYWIGEESVMPDFIIRLHAESAIRLNKKPYDSEEGRRTLFLAFPYAHIAVFDRLAKVPPDVSVPDGLIVQVKMVADNIDVTMIQ